MVNYKNNEKIDVYKLNYSRHNYYKCTEYIRELN